MNNVIAGLFTILMIFNPYSLRVRVEVKCDNVLGNFYKYHQFIVVPGKQNVRVAVPDGLKRCEIWPKILF